MSNLLAEPTTSLRPAWRPYRGKPFTRVNRRPNIQAGYPTRRFGFVPEIVQSTSNHELRNQSEKAIYDLLFDNGYLPEIEPYAMKILRNGTSNGQEGWFVPDFYVNGDEDDRGLNGTFIEVSMGLDLSNKLHKIRFVAEKYGKIVVHITRENIDAYIADPFSLIDLIAQSRIEEIDLEIQKDRAPEEIDIEVIHARLGTYLEPRIKIEKARKPKKGKRRDPHKVKTPSNRPSRNLERRAARRALRKKAHENARTIAEQRRVTERKVLNTIHETRNGPVMFKVVIVAKVVPSRYSIKQTRKPDKGKSLLINGAKPIKKSSAGPKPPAVRRINHGPQTKSAHRALAVAA